MAQKTRQNIVIITVDTYTTKVNYEEMHKQVLSYIAKAIVINNVEIEKFNLI